ncbi:SLBB domain-containing protein [Bacteroides sp. 224]|uniref:SLBB domain-containing protein n=1 Tax=Bacteroides sp. 224 TaxID=2302936 RepID=UPI0013D6879D|nr:SLBB domain-containing protein [Bacteroides sp. 224]NDV64360.1 capsule biosynthesis protein [Bacteroides sp. 224]
MHRFITLFLLVFILSGMAFAQSMSDDQVIQYVKDAQQQGLTQAQMTTELVRRGVTREQVERIKNKYEASQGSESQPSGIVRGRKNLRENAQESVSTTSFDEIEAKVEDPTEKKSSVAAAKLVFGRGYFTNRTLSFEPNSNMATPVNYQLGPGDEVIINIWGDSESTISQTISPEGSISINKLGPVYLSGMTIEKAENYMRNELSKIYSAISDNTSQVKLTLGQIRTIQINIMGEVASPGTYRLSSFSTLFHALYKAGGVNPIGSMRSIQVVRAGKKIADVDVYEYILQGKTSDDIRLMEGDVVIVPPYDCLVNISGKVKRPMYYEMKKGETVATLLKYAGGFTGDAYDKTVRLIRLSGREKQIYNIDEMDFSVFKLFDEDAISIGAVLDRFENRVEIRGAVYRDGMYQIGDGVRTVKQLIAKAEGLRGDAFLNRIQLQRELEDLSIELIPIDLRGMINGTVPDIVLQRNDILYIPSIHDLKESEMVTVHGLVARPGSYSYTLKTTIEDLIIQAGGLLEAASTARVDVARRIKDPKGATASSIIGQTYSFEIKDGYIMGDGNEFYLEPFDEIYIRKSPAYQQQQNVTVTGQVLFGGNFALTQKNERLSDIIKKAGGITPDAYVKGARLTRQMTEEEKRREGDVTRFAVKDSADDSVSMKHLEVGISSYSVGIDLEKALNKPGSDADLVLREGDQLFIPEHVNTVKINGTVMYPNTVVYKKGEKLKYYIKQAGGYGYRAKKSKAYIVYMNGTVARASKYSSKLIEPGCEIIIPGKPEKKARNTSEIISIGTSVASFAAVITGLVNLLK